MTTVDVQHVDAFGPDKASQLPDGSQGRHDPPTAQGRGLHFCPASLRKSPERADSDGERTAPVLVQRFGEVERGALCPSAVERANELGDCEARNRGRWSPGST